MLFCVLLQPSAFAEVLPGIPGFIDEMVEKHHFDRDTLTRLFDQVNHKPQIIDAINQPSTKKPWLDYRAAFVNAKRIKLGLVFWKDYQADLQRAEQKYGVPQEIIVALIGVETIYGKSTGHFRALDALTTLAFDYPRRADFFRGELENYLLLAREQHFDYLAVQGSYAGALGIPQFMPGSYRKYAVDFNGNNKIDLLGEPVDAIGSVGNYLSSYGWIRAQPIALKARVQVEDVVTDKMQHTQAEWSALGVMIAEQEGATSRLLEFTRSDGREYWLGYNNFDVITRYNNSDFYAMTVFQLAQALKLARWP